MNCSLTGWAEGRIYQIDLHEGINQIDRACFRRHGLKAPSVSRRHAIIEINGNLIAIREAGSSNGTWVDDQRLVDAAQIRPGQRLRFGTVESLLVAHPSNVAVWRATDESTKAASPVVLAESDSVAAAESLGLDEIVQPSESTLTYDELLLSVLSEVSEVLVRQRALDEICDKLLELVERVIRAQRILLLLTDHITGELNVHTAWPDCNDKGQIMLSQTLVQAAMNEPKALLLADADADNDPFRLRPSKARSALATPLFDNAQVIGLLYADSAGLFDREQLRIFTILANLIAVKITNTRLEEIEREQERITHELEVASTLQKRLLPDQVPDVPGYELTWRQEPCFEVAGDLYDAIALPDGRLLLALGDVTGKGVGAALLMSSVLASLRVLTKDRVDLLDWLDRIHRQILDSSDEMYSVTLFLAVLDPQAHRLEYVSAGHDPVVVLHADNRFNLLHASGLPAGLLPEAHYESASIDIEPGTLIAIYSDGLREARYEQELFGVERLIQSLIRRNSSELGAVADGLFSDIDDFIHADRYRDDMTLMLLRRTD